MLIASAVVTPLYNPRYLTMCLPFVALAMAAVLDAIPHRRLAIAGLAVAVALSVPSLVDQRQATAKESTDWHNVAALIQGERAMDGGTTAFIFDRVRHHPRATARVISYAYPDAFEDSIDVTLRTSAAESGRLWETTTPLTDSLSRLGGADEVYLLTSTASDGTADTTSALRPEGWVVDRTWILSDVKIVRYTKEHA